MRQLVSMVIIDNNKYQPMKTIRKQLTTTERHDAEIWPNKCHMAQKELLKWLLTPTWYLRTHCWLKVEISWPSCVCSIYKRKSVLSGKRAWKLSFSAFFQVRALSGEFRFVCFRSCCDLSVCACHVMHGVLNCTERHGINRLC